MTFEQDRRSPQAEHGGVAALAQRILLFIVAFVILHGFCLFVVAQLVRSNPGLVTGDRAAAAFLCGERTTIATDFRTRAEGGSRSIDRRIACFEPAGQEVAAPAPGTFIRLVLPAFLLVALSGFLLIARLRNVRRTVHLRSRG
jgi:hypothetical protein